jgi:DNA-binding NarL/FixJ family response regulator
LKSDEQLRVVVADDDPLVRRLIRDLFRGKGVSVVGEAENGRDAVQLVRYHRPDIALLDVVMPGMDGITALERIIADDTVETKVVMLSVMGEDDVGFVALRRGAVGYLNKQVDLTVLPRALLDAREGKAVLSRGLTTRVLEFLRETPEAGVGMRPVESVLSSREWQVLDLLCQRMGTEAIADELVLSLETVRTHIRNMMRKLDVHTREDLIAMAEELRAGPTGKPDNEVR